MIALVFLHLLQVLIWGAYKSPRELQWVVGVLLLLVTLVLGLTGYLLPWDMDAYFASQVSLNITGLAPIAGPDSCKISRRAARTMGTATINRFFGLHVWLMPAALVALVGAHLAIFRHNGSAGPVVDDPRKLKAGRFWPDQMFMDSARLVRWCSLIIVLSRAALSAVSRRESRSDESNSCRIRRGIFCRCSACWTSSRSSWATVRCRSCSRQSSSRRFSSSSCSRFRGSTAARRVVPSRTGILWTTFMVIVIDRWTFVIRAEHDSSEDRGRSAVAKRGANSRRSGRSQHGHRRQRHSRHRHGRGGWSRRKRLQDELHELPRRQRPGPGWTRAAACREFDGHRRSESRHKRPRERTARTDQGERTKLQRTDAGLEVATLQARYRRRDHLHPRRLAPNKASAVKASDIK